MVIYELRKSASKNKKHKYIYELIIDGKIIMTRRSSKEYLGIWIEKEQPGRYHWVQISNFAALIKIPKETAALALTFDELLKFKNLST